MVTTVHIADMLSVHAVRAVTTALAAVEGITSADVRLGVAVLEHDGRATAGTLREAIEAAGFRVTRIEEEPRRLQIKSD
ncbi:MAG TPA: heavy-metal-associated domain-containing protein [Gemmatimonadaceae bacterium]